MNNTKMNLKQNLTEHGCPKFFIEEALPYFSIYNGNIEEFISYVEKELENIYLNGNLDTVMEDERDMEFDEMQYDGEPYLRYA